MRRLPAICLALLLAAPAAAFPEEQPEHTQVTYKQDGKQRSISGRVIARDQEGGVGLLADDGELFLVQSDELIDTAILNTPFKPLDIEAAGERLNEEFGDPFHTYSTPHYLVVYNTSREYARWLSSLLERLHKAFTNHWSRQGLKLHEPEFPLIVVVYATEQEYREASKQELGGATGVIGYYSLKTNRVNMYDLTGVESLRARSKSRASLKDINRMLSHPSASPLVATIVHEATHQVAFNTGVMARYADLPLWLVEGMAIYFEAPDLSSGRGWRGIGKVNRPRLHAFQANLPNWNADRLTTLLQDDTPLRAPETAVSSYADSWALCYYLAKKRPREYREYVKAMAEKNPFEPATPQERLEEFEHHFGPTAKFNRDFLRYLLKLN